jgi:hypothetical protein
MLVVVATAPADPGGAWATVAVPAAMGNDGRCGRRRSPHGRQWHGMAHIAFAYFVGPCREH